MFVATAPLEVLDHLKVPCSGPTLVGAGPAVGMLRTTEGVATLAPRLFWARTGVRRDRTDYRGVFEVGRCRLAGVVRRRRPEELSADLPGDPPDMSSTWMPRTPVHDDDGRVIASVLTNARGDLYLPFDPGQVMTGLWSESYLRLGGAGAARELLRAAAVRTYYLARPALPRRLQLRLRRVWASRAPEASFPRWPVEPGLHDLYELLLGWCAEIAGGPVPWIAPWPDGAAWCLVLTHDVETARGCGAIEKLRAPERAHGYRSAWNFVPERYPTPRATLTALADEGCEIGVHGLRHDGRDLESRRTMERRRPGMQAAASAWGASGFRAPATQRSWDLMPALGFGHDSSYTDTDPYEPQPGGCCSWWPFLDRDLVELPITLPQDHTLFEILGHTDARLWLEKAARLRSRGGMVLALSHPDYAEGAALHAWQDLLDEFAGDATAWRALPREVAAWWRERAASYVVRGPRGWRVVGPAAGRARVQESVVPSARTLREPV